MVGKGSKPRPIPDRERYSENWDRIKWGTIPSDALEVAAKAGTRTDRLDGNKERERGVKQ